MGYHTLLNKILYGEKDFLKGYIFFDNEKIIDIGEEPKPEYELAELIYNYEYKSYILHGYSLTTSLTNYPFRGLDKYDLSIYSREELKKFVYTGLFELYMNGVTLPIVIDEYPDIVNTVAKENGLEIVIIHEEGTIPHYQGIRYLEIVDNKIKELNKSLKLMKCRPDALLDNCISISISGLPSYNTSLLINIMYREVGDLNKVLELLYRPYIELGLDKGSLEKNNRPDIIVYDLKTSYKTVPIEYVSNIILRGYAPDQIFVKGDIFFDHGEALSLLPIDISRIVNE